jgi:hypothetical protein
MSANSRLAPATDALTWIGLYERYSHGAATSEQVANGRGTNPVAIRRLLKELRSRGSSSPGAAGGLDAGSRIPIDQPAGRRRGPGARFSFTMRRATPDQPCVVGVGIRPAQRAIYDGVDDARLEAPVSIGATAPVPSRMEKRWDS